MSYLSHSVLAKNQWNLRAQVLFPAQSISKTISLDTYLSQASENCAIAVLKRIASLPLVGHDQKQYIDTKLVKKNKANRRVHFAPRDEVVLIPYDEEDCELLSNSSIIFLKGSEEDLNRRMESVRSSKKVSKIQLYISVYTKVELTEL